MSLFGPPRTSLVSFSCPYLVLHAPHWSAHHALIWSSTHPIGQVHVHVTTSVINSTPSFVLASFVSMSEEESPTRYMLPEQAEEGQGMVDYSLNEYSPAKYPIDTKKKKRKKKKDKKDNDKKPKTGKCVHFHTKVTSINIYRTLKNHLEELDLTNEDDYPSRFSAFVLKRNKQKQILKYQHQYRPLTPRRLVMLNHVRKTLLRENGNPSSSTSQTQTSTQTLSSSPSPS